MDQRKSRFGGKRVRAHVDHAKFSREKKRRELLAQSHAKAKMLRKYAKLCSREEIQSDRVRIGPKPADHSEAKSGSAVSSISPAPFSKEMKLAKELAEQKAEKAREKIAVQVDIKKAEKRRKVLRKEHSQRTRKGQPVMRNKINKLLGMLQKSA